MPRILSLTALAVLLLGTANASFKYSPVSGVSQNGTCGDGITCVGSDFGTCCGPDNTCGDDSDYCGTGCQPLFGACSESTLQKRYEEEAVRVAQEFARREALEAKLALAKREFEELDRRAASTCTIATKTSAAAKVASTCSATQVASHIARIKALVAHPVFFCQVWNANKPHSSSPFTSIALPAGVSNACNCIISSASTTDTGNVCNPTTIAIVKANKSDPKSFCLTWDQNKPHSSSPFTGIQKAQGVSNACDCIMADWVKGSLASTASSATTTTAKSCSKKRRRRRHLEARAPEATGGA